MTQHFELLGHATLIGAGATLVMDGWAVVLRRLGIPSLNLAHLGRWLGHLPEGHWVQSRIAEAPPVRGERALGWAAHYAIGISFAGLLLVTSGMRWAHSPTLLPALGIGVLTVVALLFILQPALGAGIASSRTSRPVFNSVKSLLTHTVFGAGLYLAARVVALLGIATG